MACCRSHRRILALMAVLFAGCLRPNEGINIRRESVQFASGRMKLTIFKDKTNKKGPAREVYVQEAPRGFCAVKILSDWLESAPPSPYVFPNFNDVSRPMSYDQARQEWIRVSRQLGIARNITLHGFRGGAATKAIEDGASVEEVMRHGRWKRAETLKAYIQVSEKTTPIASSLMSRMKFDTEDKEEKDR